MSELGIIAVSADGITLVVAVIGCAALRCGWIEGTLTVRVVPPWKRGPAGGKPAKAEPPDGGGAG